MTSHTNPIQNHGTNLPLISVVMPVWNGASYLREAIESILNQSERNFEFIIIDDGSTDDTVSIIKSYQDARIRLIVQEHKGIVVALNHGVTVSRADWIARMDCDDIAHPQRLELQWKALKKQPKSVLCHTHVRIIGKVGHTVRTSRFVRGKALLRLRLCYQCPIVHSTVVFKKSAFIASGGYLAHERHAEDLGLWGRITDHHDIIGIQKPLLYFRIHQDSISQQKLSEQMNISRDIYQHHCEKFMHLDMNAASRALSILRYEECHRSMRDWIWFLSHCLSRLEYRNCELWIWVFRRTLAIMFHTYRLVKAN